MHQDSPNWVLDRIQTATWIVFQLLMLLHALDAYGSLCQYRETFPLNDIYYFNGKDSAFWFFDEVTKSPNPSPFMHKEVSSSKI